MPITDLPFDVWYIIIVSGPLAVKDILSLSKINRLLYHLLRHDHIWNKVLNINWKSTLINYETEDNIEKDYLRFDKKNQPSCFEQAMIYYKKELYFSSMLQQYSPKGQNNIAKYLDLFTEDTDYIPIIINHVKYLEDELEKGIGSGNHLLDLTKVSLLQNLIIAQNYNIGFRFFNKLCNTDFNLEGNGCFEYFWFKLSLFDKSFHRMFKNRNRKLNEIRSLLHQEIYLKELVNKKNKRVQLIHDDEKESIVFQDDSSFMKFLLKIMRLVCSCFRMVNTLFINRDYERYYEDYFIEDFSLLRVYSNESRGHPLLIMSILAKVIDEFLLSRFILKFKLEKKEQKVSMNMTKHFLKIKNFFFLIDSKYSPNTPLYDIQAFSLEEVIHNLRVTFNYNTHAKISQVLAPVGLKYMAEYFLNLDAHYGNKSMYSLLRTEHFLFDKDSSPQVDSLFLRKITLIKPEEYNFVKFVCKFLLNKREDGGFLDYLYCSELEKYLNYGTNFIHFNTLFGIIDNDPSKYGLLAKHFKFKSNGKYFSNYFDLNDLNSRISFTRIIRGLTFSRNKTIKNNPNDIPIGSLVGHTKFHTLGVNLCKVEESSRGNGPYYYVYTTSKTIEVYDEGSLVSIDKIHHKNQLILIYFLYVCGIDVLGLLFFKELKIADSDLRFIKYD